MDDEVARLQRELAQRPLPVNVIALNNPEKSGSPMLISEPKAPWFFALLRQYPDQKSLGRTHELEDDDDRVSAGGIFLQYCTKLRRFAKGQDMPQDSEDWTVSAVIPLDNCCGYYLDTKNDHERCRDARAIFDAIDFTPVLPPRFAWKRRLKTRIADLLVHTPDSVVLTRKEAEALGPIRVCASVCVGRYDWCAEHPPPERAASTE